MRELTEKNNLKINLYSLWIEIYENEWLTLMNADILFTEKYRLFKSYLKNDILKKYISGYSELKNKYRKIDNIYLLLIKKRFVILWMTAVKAKVLKNK